MPDPNPTLTDAGVLARRVLVCGGRDYHNEAVMLSALSAHPSTRCPTIMRHI